ncbi:MAG: prolyl oligopeptidase family serine peptidase [Clostridia bacterium]
MKRPPHDESRDVTPGAAGELWNPEAVIDWTVPGALEAHPDGHFVVMQCRRPDVGRNRYLEWLAVYSDQGLVPLTQGPGDGIPRLSPDGAWLLYRRRERAHDLLMLLPLGAAGMKTVAIDLARPGARVSDIAWQPDSAGAALLVEADGGHFVLGWDRLSGEVTYAASSLLPYRLPAWLPDGRIVVVAHVQEEGDLEPVEVLQSLGPGGVEPVVLEGFRGRIGAVAVSPRGDVIMFTGTPAGSAPALIGPHLYQLPLEGGAAGVAANITAHWDRPVGVSLPGNLAPADVHTLRFSPGGTALYAIVANQGRSELYRWTDLHRTPERVPDLPWSLLDFAPTAEGLWFVAATSTEPPELYRWKDGAEPVSTLNRRRLHERSSAAPEPFVIDGGRFAVSGWRLRPAGRAPHPTVLLLHGGPGGGFGPGFHSGAQLLAAHGYLVVMANPRGSVSYGSAFSAAVAGDPGGGDFQDLMAVLDEHLAGSLADAERMAIVGYGYGGFLAAWAITQTDRFRAAIVGAPAVNWLSLYGTGAAGLSWFESLIGGPPWQHLELAIERSPIAHVAHVRTPTLILVGEQDTLYPPSEARQLEAALRRMDVPARLVEFAGEGHRLSRPAAQIALWQEILGWLAQWVPAAR